MYTPEKGLNKANLARYADAARFRDHIPARRLRHIIDTPLLLVAGGAAEGVLPCGLGRADRTADALELLAVCGRPKCWDWVALEGCGHLVSEERPQAIVGPVGFLLEAAGL